MKEHNKWFGFPPLSWIDCVSATSTKTIKALGQDGNRVGVKLDVDKMGGEREGGIFKGINCENFLKENNN